MAGSRCGPEATSVSLLRLTDLHQAAHGQVVAMKAESRNDTARVPTHVGDAPAQRRIGDMHLDGREVDLRDRVVERRVADRKSGRIDDAAGAAGRVRRIELV